MVILIIVKWCTVWEDPGEAPSIIGFLIDMFLGLGSIRGKHLLLTHALNEWLHILLLFIAFVCVPAMLFVKPYLINKHLKKALDVLPKREEEEDIVMKDFHKFDDDHEEEKKSDEELMHHNERKSEGSDDHMTANPGINVDRFTILLQ